ncbi:MAG: hypothetical protein AAF433_08860 [Bacteroidota bacterium]
MTISLQSTVNHPSNCKGTPAAVDSMEMKSLLEDILKRKNELDKARINWVDDETLELGNVSQQCLHQFLLEAEKCGQDISFTKQTIITIN